MPTRRGRIVLLGVIALLAASLWRTASVQREKTRIADTYAQAQQMLRQLEEERARLNEELGEDRQTIETQATDMAGLRGELQGMQDRLSQTATELAALQREHEQLRQQHASLSTQLDAVMVEKQQLEAKLSSLRELKLAIRDVKRKMWAQRWVAWRARAEAQRTADQERLAMGNRGFVILSGRPTLGAASKLQVHVLEPQSQ